MLRSSVLSTVNQKQVSVCIWDCYWKCQQYVCALCTWYIFQSSYYCQVLSCWPRLAGTVSSTSWMLRVTTVCYRHSMSTLHPLQLSALLVSHLRHCQHLTANLLLIPVFISNTKPFFYFHSTACLNNMWQPYMCSQIVMSKDFSVL